MVLKIFLFILSITKNSQSHASGFDAYSSCYRTSRKRQELPCDFGSQTWCTIPGNTYPWHAVRRFVHENQGLMRRMYGDERHISVLRAELESNDIELFDVSLVKEEFRRRYSKDMDRTKEFVRMFLNTERKKFFGDRSSADKLDKIKKSIQETSNNVLYQSHSKSDNLKIAPGNGISDRTVAKTATARSTTTTTAKATTQTLATTTAAAATTTTTTTPGTMETTYGTFLSESTLNYTTTATTTESSNSYGSTDATVQPMPSERFHFNLTLLDTSNDTQYDETYEYDSETEEPETTTAFDEFTTTEINMDGQQPQKEKSENYEEVVAEVEEEMVKEEEQEPIREKTTKKPAPPEPSTMIRLKGINACPVKEEVVAPFWANNTRGEVLALLNLYPFEQYVHWEKCMYEHNQMFCREGCRCEQQYRLHRLLAYDPNNECRGIFSDWFRFPSCCVCKCYDLPLEFRLTSRSPRFKTYGYQSPSPSFSSSSAIKDSAPFQP